MFLSWGHPHPACPRQGTSQLGLARAGRQQGPNSGAPGPGCRIAATNKRHLIDCEANSSLSLPSITRVGTGTLWVSSRSEARLAQHGRGLYVVVDVLVLAVRYIPEGTIPRASVCSTPAPTPAIPSVTTAERGAPKPCTYPVCLTDFHITSVRLVAKRGDSASLRLLAAARDGSRRVWGAVFGGGCSPGTQKPAATAARTVAHTHGESPWAAGPRSSASGQPGT